jgi:hypothetical protein
VTREALNERWHALNGDQRRLAVLLAVLCGVATVFVGRNVFDSGSHNSTGSVPSRQPAAELHDRLAAAKHATTPALQPKKKPAAKKASVTTATTVLQLSEAETFEVFETRDPFAPPENPTPTKGQTVAVLGIFADSSGKPRAHVRVRSTVYNVGAGDTFAVSYEVVSLKDRCGQFLFGDSTFQLCAGEETIK